MHQRFHSIYAVEAVGLERKLLVGAELEIDPVCKPLPVCGAYGSCNIKVKQINAVDP